MTVGRGHYFNKNVDARQSMRETFYHEKVHQFMKPKLYLLRELRIYLHMNAYNRSYLLRYLSEAMAETYAMLRVHGFNGQYIIKGIKFPLENGYEVTFALMGQEAKGFLLGPIMVE